VAEPTQPATDANVCGSLPDYTAGVILKSVDGLAPISADKDGHFNLYYYPAANGFGTNFDQIVVRGFDRPADQAATLLAQAPYVPTTIGIDVLRSNQAPQIFYQTELISGTATSAAEPARETVGRGASGQLAKKLQFVVTDVDAGNAPVMVNLTTDKGAFVGLKATLAAPGTQFVTVVAADDDSSATFVGRIPAINLLLANLVLKTPSTALVTIAVNDLGNTGASNPKCPDDTSFGYWQLSGQAASQVGAAVGGAAAAGVLISTGLAAGAGLIAWVVARKTGALDEAAVPFDDDAFASSVTDSPAFVQGSYGGANPLQMSKAQVDGNMGL